MRIYDKETKETVCEIITNHSMCIDEALDLCCITVNDDGQLIQEDEELNAWYDDLEMEW